jgi:phosphatidylinositol alpha 1,6-mannosyltransferase
LNGYPRVAFLPDTFHEVNGVAHTSRHLEAFARRRQRTFLSIHGGSSLECSNDGPVRIVQLRRGPLRISLDANLDYDLALMRYNRRVRNELSSFGAELIHVTGPGDFGTVGCYLAWRLKLPLLISWHTSLHEYAGRRVERLLKFLGRETSRRLGLSVEKLTFRVLQWFYRRATVVLAPNEEIVNQVRGFTDKPVFLMSRGVDTALFTPARRSRTDNTFRIGYVGRLTPEKNVRFLAELAAALSTLGRTGFEFMIVGEGSEENWLRAHLPNATFTGVLRGERLAAAYASFDLFAFPSQTDTFGNVVLEALASGVPAVVMASGGPKFLIRPGITGSIAPSQWDFISSVNSIMTNPELHRHMRQAARIEALTKDWDNTLESVFAAYQVCVEAHATAGAAQTEPLLSSRVHGRGCS